MRKRPQPLCHTHSSALLERVWPDSLGDTATSIPDPLARADATPLWWTLWDAQNWKPLQNKHLFAQTGWQRWREYTNGEWPPGRSPRLQTAAKLPEMMRKKGRCFPRVHERIPWSLFSQETVKTCWTKRQKGLCKEKGLFPNTLFYLSHPAIVFYCSNRSQLQRLETFWKARCRDKRVQKKPTSVSLQTC